MNLNQIAKILSDAGRGTDTQVAHVTPGEIVLPRDVINASPGLMGQVLKAFKDYNKDATEKGLDPLDWMDYMVQPQRAGAGNFHPVTGAQEFKVSRGAGAGPAGVGGIGGSGAGGGSIGRDRMGTAGGMSLGVRTGRDVDRRVPVSASPGPAPAAAPAPTWQRPDLGEVPAGLAGLSPLQQRTAIATGATLGSSFGGQNYQDYYNRLLANEFIGDDGVLAESYSLQPIESQYLSQVRGLDYGVSTEDLLRALGLTPA